MRRFFSVSELNYGVSQLRTTIVRIGFADNSPICETSAQIDI